MKIKIIISITIMIVVAMLVIYCGDDRKITNRASAQVGNGCNSYSPSTQSCGGDSENCQLGEYNISAAFLNGLG